MSEVYKVGMEIALTGGLSAALATITGQLVGMNGHVKEIEKGLGGWHSAVVGIASIAAGGALVVGLNKAVSAGGQLVKAQTELYNMGVSHADVMATTLDAQKATALVIGTTIAENVKGMRELMGVMPNLDEAREKYVGVMRAAKVLESLTGRPADESMQTLAKAIELRGGGMNPETHQLDPERFGREADAAVRAIVASGGLVSDRQLLQFMQTAGPMARMMTDPIAFYKGALTSIMDMGGFRAGTAMTAVGRQLLGGKMTKPTAEEMEDMGLLKPGSWHGSGMAVRVDKGGLAGEDILKDPAQGVAAWMNQVLIPAFAAKHITSSPDVQQELYRVFGTETGRRMAGLFIQNKAQIDRDANLIDKVRPDSYENMTKGDYAQNVKNLQTAVESFLQSFGSPMVPVAITGLQSISGVINAISGAMIAHPDAAKAFGEAIAVLAATLITAGTAVLIVAGVTFAPITAFVAAVTAAAVAIAALNWDKLTQFFSEIATFLGGGPAVATGASPEILSAGRTWATDQTQILAASRLIQKDMHQGADMEAHRGAALSALGRALPAPQVKTDVKVDVKAYLDSSAIAAKVESKITQNNRAVSGASDHDNSAAWSPPDMTGGP